MSAEVTGRRWLDTAATESLLATPFVVVVVGTDYHPFDRLVGWSDRWMSSREGMVRGLIQSGTSAPPSACSWQPYLPTDELTALFTDASAVVCHGGPATIMGARAAGLLPIVVPRLKTNGEHVDDHQLRFTRWMAARGEVATAGSEDELGELLDRALLDTGTYRIDSTAASTAEAVRRFGHLIDELLA